MMIPLQLLIDVLAFFAAFMAGSFFFSEDEEGYGFFIVAILIGFILLVITSVVMVKSIVGALKSLRTRKDAEESSDITENLPTPRWYYLIPVVIQIIISVIVVFIVGNIEINQFYANPDHVGFAIPIITFLIAALMALVTLIVIVVCIILAAKQSKSIRQSNK